MRAGEELLLAQDADQQVAVGDDAVQPRVAASARASSRAACSLVGACAMTLASIGS